MRSRLSAYNSCCQGAEKFWVRGCKEEIFVLNSYPKRNICVLCTVCSSVMETKFIFAFPYTIEPVALFHCCIPLTSDSHLCHSLSRDLFPQPALCFLLLKLCFRPWILLNFFIYLFSFSNCYCIIVLFLSLT